MIPTSHTRHVHKIKIHFTTPNRCHSNSSHKCSFCLQNTHSANLQYSDVMACALWLFFLFVLVFFETLSSYLINSVYSEKYAVKSCFQLLNPINQWQVRMQSLKINVSHDSSWFYIFRPSNFGLNNKRFLTSALCRKTFTLLLTIILQALSLYKWICFFLQEICITQSLDEEVFYICSGIHVCLWLFTSL